MAHQLFQCDVFAWRSHASGDGKSGFFLATKPRRFIHNYKTLFGSLPDIFPFSELNTRRREFVCSAMTQEEAAHSVTELQCAETENKGSDANSMRPTVLIIDHCRVTRCTVRLILSKMGYDVEEASNGQDGLGLMKRKLFTCVLFDVLMPVMDGLQCIRELRQWEQENHKLTQVVHCVTGSELHANFANLGFSSFTAKPYTRTVLDNLLG